MGDINKRLDEAQASIESSISDLRHKERLLEDARTFVKAAATVNTGKFVIESNGTTVYVKNASNDRGGASFSKDKVGDELEKAISAVLEAAASGLFERSKS